MNSNYPPSKNDIAKVGRIFRPVPHNSVGISLHPLSEKLDTKNQQLINQSFLIGLTVLLPFDVIGIFLRHRLVDIIGDKTIELGITRCVDLLYSDIGPVLGEVVFGVAVSNIVDKSPDANVLVVIKTDTPDADRHIVPRSGSHLILPVRDGDVSPVFTVFQQGNGLCQCRCIKFCDLIDKLTLINVLFHFFKT